MLLMFFRGFDFCCKYLNVRVLTFIGMLLSFCLASVVESQNLNFLAPAHRGFISVSNLKSIKAHTNTNKKQNISYQKISEVVDNYGKIGVVFNYIPDGVRVYFIDSGGALLGMDNLYVPYAFDLSNKAEFVHSISVVYKKVEDVYKINPGHIGALYVLADTDIPYQQIKDPVVDLDGVKGEPAPKKLNNEIIDVIKDDYIGKASFDVSIINTPDLRCLGEAALNFGDLFTGLENFSVVREIKADLNNYYFSGNFGERQIYKRNEPLAQNLLLSDTASVLTVPAIINDIISSFLRDNGNVALMTWLGLDKNYAQIRYLLQKRSYYNESATSYTISDTDKYSTVYLKLKHKIAAGDPWMTDYMDKLLSDLGALCGKILEQYPKGYYIALKIEENLNFGIIPRRNAAQESKIIISGDFLGEFLALNDLEGEKFIQVIREKAGLTNDSKNIINSAYSTSVDSYALSVIFSDFRETSLAKNPKAVKYNADTAAKNADILDDKYSFLNYISKASEFFAQKYGITVGDDATIYMRVGRDAVIGKDITIDDKCNFILTCDEYKRSKVYIGSNVKISADVDITVKGAGNVVFADNAVLTKDVNLVVPETSIAYIQKSDVTLYPKNPEAVLTEAFDIILTNVLTVDGDNFAKVITALYENVFNETGVMNEATQNTLYQQLSAMLSQKEADFLMDLFSFHKKSKDVPEEFSIKDKNSKFEIYPFFKVNAYTDDVKQNPVSNMLYQYKTVGLGAESAHIIEKYMTLANFEDIVFKANSLVAAVKEKKQVKYFTLADYKLSTILDRAT